MYFIFSKQSVYYSNFPISVMFECKFISKAKVPPQGNILATALGCMINAAHCEIVMVRFRNAISRSCFAPHNHDDVSENTTHTIIIILSKTPETQHTTLHTVILCRLSVRLPSNIRYFHNHTTPSQSQLYELRANL